MLGNWHGGRRPTRRGGVVGDAAVASRNEVNQRYAARLLVGEATRDALPPGAFSLRPVDRVAVKGRTRAQTLFEVLDGAARSARLQRRREASSPR
ncbi:MAG: hypothetical protein R3A48_04435 [Polyangiales bacterium]